MTMTARGRDSGVQDRTKIFRPFALSIVSSRTGVIVLIAVLLFAHYITQRNARLARPVPARECDSRQSDKAVALTSPAYAIAHVDVRAGQLDLKPFARAFLLDSRARPEP